MSYLRYNTPLPEPLPDLVTIQMLANPEAAAAIMAEHQRIPADFLVRTIASTPGRIQISHREQPDQPITMLWHEAQKAATKCPQNLLPDEAPHDEIRLAAISGAVRRYIDDITPYGRPENITHMPLDAMIATVDWLFDGEVGISSRAIAYTAFARRPPTKQAPLPPADHADFRRCLLLIGAVPEASRGLDILALHDPRWDFLRDHWQLLADCYEQESADGRFVNTNAIIHRNFRATNQ